MAKAEWGTKRTCPKCGERFYDLKKDPVICIACDNEWVPEPILKAKQPIIVSNEPKPSEAEDSADEAEEDDIDIDEDSIADVSLDDDDDDEVASMVDSSLEKSSDE